jgi:ABC-type uncharacterized transport system substrate-binding protein
VIGKQTGELASRILHGADPAQIPVTNEVPFHFVVNTTAMKDLKQQWRIPDDILLSRAPEWVRNKKGRSGEKISSLKLF